MNKYLEKIAVSRLVKEISLGKVTKSLSDLVSSGILRPEKTYVKGMKAGNKILADKINAKISKPRGLAAEALAKRGGGYTILPNNKTDSLIIQQFGLPFLGRKSAIHQMGIRHEIYEGRELRKRMGSTDTYNLRDLIKAHQAKTADVGNKYHASEILRGMPAKDIPKLPPGKTHLHDRVLLSESIDVSKNPYLGLLRKIREGNLDAKTVSDITGRPYGQHK